ncbi:hypothetical protein HV341_10490 [Citrobacter sp. RHBSTW-00976]|uniref:helix-turn-helix domain-containing protein n=1 Tax=Citrobacter sp. RHBSTW-00976 TaxID=2742674 RepID=UPI0015EA533D|nr:helix-turn-helix transcriptional regulator [Citrobacter sp. RHBSTW-00976]QLR62466.1 hypothetical protein HV341_10490 [Citrobacter sp. RHBSTW-00976]
MNDVKGKDFAFEDDRKEKLVGRIRQLAERHKSLRAAARDWGLSFSTLNNYINRGTEPSFFVMHDISIKENVSMDWLAYGSHDPFEFNKVIIDLQRTQSIPGRDTWCMIFDNLESEERKMLINFCLKEGAPSLARLVSHTSPLDKEFLALSTSDKERLVRLYEQMKKGSPEADSGVGQEDLTSTDKKAG